MTSTELDIKDMPGKTCAWTVHGLVAEQAARTPDSIAVQSGQESITYAQLEARSNQLANALRRRGIGAEARVAVALPGSIDAVMGILAVLKCGAAYVPIDPAYPPERTRLVLADAQPVLLLTRQNLLDQLGDLIPKLAIDALWSEAAHESVNPPEVESSPRNLAYIIYTSGSTGLPKGVCVEHASLCNLVAGQIAAFALGPDSCVLQFASLAFDASVSEIFTALCSGAALRVAARSELMPGDPLLATLRDRVSTVTLPPSLLAVLADNDLQDLITVVSAGEPCSDAVLARWSQGRRFINAYGPTEATVCATLYHAQGEASGAIIGYPLQGVSAYVLDIYGRPVPIGVKGELYIGGACVARGYLNQPALTAERFVPDPFMRIAGARMYRTGDIVRKLAGGALEFIGRSDRQLNIRGYRVEPREIEAALLQQEAVADAVVFAEHVGTSEARLLAYVVPRGAPVSGPDLRRRLQTLLPDYMLPARIISIPELPLTVNGKVDRSRLLPIRDAQPVKHRSLLPRTTVEQALAQIWCEALGVDSVGITDDFFAIGGNSILAVQVIAQIEEIWGRVVPIAELLEERTVQHLASLIHDASTSPRRGRSVVTRIQPHGSRPPLLLCHAIGGSALCYLKLARQLTSHQPVWALESPMLHSAAPPPSSIQEAAARLVDALDGIAVDRYCVGGWSFGGILAFELALELERRGKQVERIFLFDPGAPRPVRQDGNDFLEMVSGFARRSGLPFRTEEYDSLDREGQIEAMQQGLDGLMPPATAAALVRELRASAAHIAVRQAYIPSGTCAAPISLFRALLQAGEDAAPDQTDVQAWTALTRAELVLTDVESSHGGMLLEPHVAVVADTILRQPIGTL